MNKWNLINTPPKKIAVLKADNNFLYYCIIIVIDKILMKY